MKIHFLAFALFTSLAVAQTPDDVPPAFEKSPESDGGTSVKDPFDPLANAPKSLQAQMEYIELSHEAFTKLMFLAKPETSDAGPLREQLQEMVAKNEAKVLETQFAVGKSGHKFTTESILEFIYPTEYEPPSLPCGGPSKDSSPENLISSMMPTAFDTRNTGSTFEVEPTTTEDGKIIDIRLLAELVWHTGNTNWLENKDGLGNNHKVQMPDFYALRLNTSVTCANGQYTLVAVQSPKDGNGKIDMTRKVMMFLKCNVVAVK